MADNARGIHVSPGIYTREIDMTYAVRSLGITTLGVAGETLKGPAFQPMDIANWREFKMFLVEQVLRNLKEVSILNMSCLTLLSHT